MGGNHGAATINTLTCLKFVDVAAIANHLARKNHMTSPKMDIDASQVCLQMGKGVAGVINVMQKYAKVGLRVVPVCDGTRPVSKQATPARAARREKNRIDAFVLRTEAAREQRELNRNADLSDDERARVQREIDKKVTSMKSKETQSRNAVHPDFADMLEEALEQIGAHTVLDQGGSIDYVLKAEYQADGLMMHRLNAGKTLMVVSTDVDLIWIGGNDVIQVKKYTKDGDIEIASSSIQTIQQLHDCLPDDAKNRTNIVRAKYPLFEAVPDRPTRAMIALVLGCDVYETGVKGIGPMKLEKRINELYPKWWAKQKGTHPYPLLEYLRQYMIGVEGGEDFNLEVVNSLLSALLYEPTKEEPADDN